MTEQEMWEAVQHSDASYDGLFFYAVKTTGIFCRPSCKSKPPKRENLIPKGASSAMKGTAIYHSTVGDIQLDYEDGAVTALKNADADAKADAPNELTELVFRQLDEYFAGTRKTFDFPYRLHGTPFQEKVWAALREIPYGETRSYKDIAEAIGHPKAFRAVGMANHANPIFIAIPCHRVIGASGSLVGYGGGLEMKRALLELERTNSK